MAQQITCPHCAERYDLNEVLTQDIEKQLKAGVQKELLEKQKELDQAKAQFEATKLKENELFQARLQKEKKNLEDRLKKEAEKAQEGKMTALQEKLELEQEKSHKLQKLEVEKMELEKSLKAKEEEMSLRLQKESLKIEEELREKLGVELLSKEREKHDLEKQQLHKQLNDAKKSLEDSQRKINQGSMQTQGEVMELEIEAMLAQNFPFDLVDEVKKGQHGADCILNVRNSKSQVCGKIVIESKNAENFSKDWISKLKSDLQKAQGDVALLVTKNMPKELQGFDSLDGVWICQKHEMVSLIKSLRTTIVEVDRLNQSQNNKGDKKEMLFNYFISNEFRHHIRSINEAYLGLKDELAREQTAMRKIWKRREKQIEKVLNNNNDLIGSVEGITGQEIDDSNLLE